MQRSFLFFGKTFFLVLEMTILLGIAPHQAMAAKNPLRQVFEAATKALQAGDYQRAIDLYEACLEIYPGFAPAYYYLGLAHQAAGTDLREVMWLFQKAVQIKPDYVQAYDQLSRVAYALGLFGEAEQAALKAVDINPKLVRPHLALGWIYLIVRNQPLDAVEHFQQVLQQKEMPAAEFGLGLAYYRAGQRFRVLEMITALRQKGHEASASQLEKMLHTGADILPPSIPAMPSSAPESVLVDEAPSFQAAGFSGGDMTVRLRDKIENVLSGQPVSRSDLSGAERIRLLQRRGLGQPKR